MGTEKLVFSLDEPVQLTGELLERLVSERRCIIFSVLGAGGSLIPVRVRTNRKPRMNSKGVYEIDDAWLPDCPGGDGEKADKCVVRYNPETEETVLVEGKLFWLMGSIEMNLSKVPEFVKPSKEHPVLSR